MRSNGSERENFAIKEMADVGTMFRRRTRSQSSNGLRHVCRNDVLKGKCRVVNENAFSDNML
jgi:hypothetical protein